MIEKYKVGEYGLENETKGMYARTNNGIIGRIINSNSEEMINGPELLVNNKIYCVERNSIKDIQESIIDLLEVGDIVDKSEVYEIGQSDDGQKCVHTYNGKLYYENELVGKTILTKEAYQANCYTVERNEEC